MLLFYVVLFFVDGDLSAQHTVTTAYMKQKHRMLWERRHGPVGSGMKKGDICAEPDDH